MRRRMVTVMIAKRFEDGTHALGMKDFDEGPTGRGRKIWN